MNRFILIDGNAIIHRAYHALPPLTSKTGEVVNAVYGFFSMFLKIIEDLKPSFIAVCFDRPKPTFRQELYVGYQAKRPKMADDLVPQIALVHKVLEKAGVAIFEVDGYEADDLIGTLAVQVLRAEVGNKNFLVHDAKKDKTSSRISKPASVHSENFVPSPRVSGLEVIILSGDRDMLQLVNSHVRMLAPVTGMTNMIIFDSDKVEHKFGVKPSQIVDYKALVGDSSDNYPGVSGIGPKTAVELLKKYETFENLYEHISELPVKIAEKLSTDAEQAALCKKLATIITDVPIRLSLHSCECSKINRNGLKESFEELGFKSLLKRLQNGTQETKGTEETEGAGGKKAKRVQEHIKQLGLL